MAIDWTEVDAIEVATCGIDREEPVATGHESVSRIDGEDPAGYRFSSHSVYVHYPGRGVECVADCWDRNVAQQIGQALAAKLAVPVDDYTIEMEQD